MMKIFEDDEGSLKMMKDLKVLKDAREITSGSP